MASETRRSASGYLLRFPVHEGMTADELRRQMVGTPVTAARAPARAPARTRRPRAQPAAAVPAPSRRPGADVEAAARAVLGAGREAPPPASEADRLAAFVLGAGAELEADGEGGPPPGASAEDLA